MKSITYSLIICSFLFCSCVSTGTYKALQGEKAKSDSLYTWAMTTLKASQVDNARLSREKAAIRDSMSDLTLDMAAVKQNNTMLHKQLTDLSAISTAQAESIRKSIDNIGAKDQYLQTLQMAVSRRDSLNLAVLLEVKAAMGSFSDSQVGIKVAGGVVSLTVADTLLFGDDSANYTVTDRGKTVLLRLSRVMRDQPVVGCRVEAYSDSVGIPPDSVMDGWELRTRRAASVVRILQNLYNVTAARLTAVGHGELGRGTRVVLVPPAGELSEALEKR